MLSVKEVDQLLPSNIKVVSRKEVASVDFTELVNRISSEGNLLHPEVSDLEQSFEQGMSAVALVNGRVVGHSRYEELLNPTLSERLGLPQGFPQIWEMGSSIVYREYRGQHVSTQIRRYMVADKLEQMQKGEVLVMGTTKTRGVPAVFEHIKQEFGLSLAYCHRDKLPMVTAFTCVCSGEFGCGVQNGEHCFANDSEAPKSVYLGREQLRIVDKDNIKCTMFIFDTNLADQIDTELANHFGNRKELVKSLSELGYYSNAK